MEPDRNGRPPLPRRKQYNRKFSVDQLPGTSSAEDGAMVVTEAKISIQFQQPLASQSTSAPKQAYTLSKSFSYESGGVKRRVPVMPAVNTSHRHHETSYYKHGTLVFPTPLRPRTVASPDSSKIILSVPITSSPKETLATKLPREPMPSSLVLDFCKGADLDALKAYLKNAAPGSIGPGTINMRDASDQTGLWYACGTGNVSIARELLRLQGIDVNAVDKEGNSALHVAAQAGQADIVSLLTLAPSIDIECRNSAGLTPLMKAALQGRLRCARILLLAGASISARDHGRGLCALEWAKLCNRTKCADLIESFIRRAVPIQSSDSSRWTSEPNLKRSVSAGSLTSAFKSKESWVKSTIKKALQSLGGRSPTPSDSSSVINVASQITNAAWCSAMPLLPRAERCEPNNKPQTVSESTFPTQFAVPQIQINFWSPTTVVSSPESPSLAPPPQVAVQKLQDTTFHATSVPRSGVTGGQPSIKPPSRMRARRLRNMTSPEGFLPPKSVPPSSTNIG